MTFTLLLLLAVGLSMTLAVLLLRRHEVRSIESRLEERSKARQTGSHHARLLYPHVDLSRCIGHRLPKHFILEGRTPLRFVRPSGHSLGHHLLNPRN